MNDRPNPDSAQPRHQDDDRDDVDLQVWRKTQGIENTWGASDRLLVCISPSPYSANLLLQGRRIAAGLHAQWCAVNVETPATLRLPPKARTQLMLNLRLAEQLGAETVTLSGEQSAEEILRFARERSITKIVVGKPRTRSFRERFQSSFVDELILRSGTIDIYATTGEPQNAPRADPEPTRRPTARSALEYLAACGVSAAFAAVAFAVFGREHTSDVLMTQLLGVVIVSTRFGFWPSMLNALLSVLFFDFFFIPPYFRFSVEDARHLLTFGAMLLVAGVIAGLTRRVRGQVNVARRSERRTAALHALSQDLFHVQEINTVLRAAGRRIEGVLACRVAAFVPEESGTTRTVYASDGLEPADTEQDVVRWVLAHKREAGCGTSTLAGSRGFYVPLVGAAEDAEVFGVLGLHPKEGNDFDDPEARHLASALARQIVVALERGRLVQEAEQARVKMEAEQFRNALLSSVSHDLRTPLAVMRGAATTLLDDDAALSVSVRRDLTHALVEETERLDRRVRDLLDLSRLESGTVRLRKEWQSVEEMIGAALNQTEFRLTGHPVSADVPSTLLAPCDSVLIQQVLVNLLENAAKYTDEGTQIDVTARALADHVMIEIADRGDGVPAEERSRIFNKFHRAHGDPSHAGVGLGLTICRAIVLAHGGRIWVEDRKGGGAAFRFTLPAQGEPPSSPLPEFDDSVTSKRSAP